MISIRHLDLSLCAQDFDHGIPKVKSHIRKSQATRISKPIYEIGVIMIHSLQSSELDSLY